MATQMTKLWLVQHCRERGLYQTPYLNDRLYLQCQGFSDLQNLEEYTGVKMLYLEENCLTSLTGLQPLKQLQCLYLRRNLIKSIDHLEELRCLDTLDISHNCLTRLENLSNTLRVLVVSHNQLESTESITHLFECPSIMILDLSHNKLQDGDAVLGVLSKLPQLAVLYLSGNPCVSQTSHYRKKFIGQLTKLSHLDERPVFWDERQYAEAWLRGGLQEERAERDRVREQRDQEERRQFEAMRQMRDQNMEQRQNLLPLPMLQFDQSELGQDVERLYSPDDIHQEPIVETGNQALHEFSPLQDEPGLKEEGERSLFHTIEYQIHHNTNTVEQMQTSCENKLPERFKETTNELNEYPETSPFQTEVTGIAIVPPSQEKVVQQFEDGMAPLSSQLRSDHPPAAESRVEALPTCLREEGVNNIKTEKETFQSDDEYNLGSIEEVRSKAEPTCQINEITHDHITSDTEYKRGELSEVDEVRPTPGPSMFGEEIQSICLPEWTGPEKTERLFTQSDGYQHQP